MAKLYYRKVKAGLMEIEEVPWLWKDQVQVMLDADAEAEKQ